MQIRVTQLKNLKNPDFPEKISYIDVNRINIRVRYMNAFLRLAEKAITLNAFNTKKVIKIIKRIFRNFSKKRAI